MKVFAIGALMLCAANCAAAQDGAWTYTTTIYGWLPGMTTAVDTAIGTIESESSASDALSSLDMVFMGAVAAQRDRWGFVGDLLYLDLSNERRAQSPLFGGASAGVTATVLSGYALYRLTPGSDGSGVLFDIGAGFRAFDLEMDLDLAAGLLPGFSQSVNGRWVDPLVAARLAVPVNGDWSLTGFADWGGTGGGDETWQVFGAIRYAPGDRWATQVGYRYMEISKELDGRKVSVDLGGPVIAVSYRF